MLGRAVGTVPVVMLADRFGYKAALLAGAAVMLMAYLLVFVHFHVHTLLLASILLGCVVTTLSQL